MCNFVKKMSGTISKDDVIQILYFIVGLVAMIISSSIMNVSFISILTVVGVPFVVALALTFIFYDKKHIDTTFYEQTYNKFNPEQRLALAVANYANRHSFVMKILHFIFHFFSSGMIILCLILTLNYFEAGDKEMLRCEIVSLNKTNVVFLYDGEEYNFAKYHRAISLYDTYCEIDVRKGFLDFYVLDEALLESTNRSWNE